MGKCKIKAIQADLGIFRYIPVYSGIFRHIPVYSGIFRHNQTYSGMFGIIQAYSEPCVTLAFSGHWHIQNPGIIKTSAILRTLVYPKLWHIQNQGHIQDPGSEPEAYSEPCQISSMERFDKQLTTIIIFASHHYFRNVSFSSPLLLEI